jgi:hypothetical protein
LGFFFDKLPTQNSNLEIFEQGDISKSQTYNPKSIFKRTEAASLEEKILVFGKSQC